MTTEAINRAQALVKRLNEAGVPAAIAGGFARDALYGRPIADVDLLVEVYEPEDIPGFVKTVSRIMNADLEDSRTLAPDAAEQYLLGQRGESFLYGVWQSPHCNLGLPLDVLFTNDITARVESFPDGLSKVVLDGTAVDQYPESLTAYGSKSLGYTGDLLEPGHLRRVSKLLDKYEGFSIG